MDKGHVYILTNPSLREVSCGEREVKEKIAVDLLMYSNT